MLECYYDDDVSSSNDSATESVKVVVATTCSTWKDKYSVSMIMMYTCSYFEYIRKERLMAFFSRKGFPRVNHGVYCAYILCNVMRFYFQQHLLLLL